LRKLQGFSLIELVIVILIISILAAMPFFNLQTGLSVNVNAQAQQFTNHIRYTQALSMAKEERYRISKISTNTYQILNSSGTAIIFPSGSNRIVLVSSIVFGAWTNLPNNLIAFNGLGTPYLDTGTPGTALTSGTTYSITLTDGTTSKTVSITPITGRVTVS